jgi:hypothetical protein
MTLQFTYTPEDLAEAAKLPPLPGSAAARRKWLVRRAIGWALFVGLAAAVLFILMPSDPTVPEYPRPRPRAAPPSDTFVSRNLLPLAPWAGLFVLIWVVTFWRLRRSTVSSHQKLWNSDPQLQMPHTLHVRDEGVELSSVAVMTRWRWDAFVGLAETTYLFVLLLPRAQRLAVPKRALYAMGKVDEFRTLLHARVPAPPGGHPPLPPP